MLVTIKIEKEFDIKKLQVNAGVRYWEDATINGVSDEEGTLTPCKDGDLWSPVINVETGIIENWPQGTTANIHFKVCDQCSVSLLDENNEIVKGFEGYVPKTLCPKDEGYGDYIIMDINENGQIQDWKPSIHELIEYMSDED